jgi:hypothetical protein
VRHQGAIIANMRPVSPKGSTLTQALTPRNLRRRPDLSDTPKEDSTSHDLRHCPLNQVTVPFDGNRNVAGAAPLYLRSCQGNMVGDPCCQVMMRFHPVWGGTVKMFRHLRTLQCPGTGESFADVIVRHVPTNNHQR